MKLSDLSEPMVQTPGPIVLTEDERQSLRDLEGYAVDWGSYYKVGSREYDFGVAVYQALHWVNSPACRKNHPNWAPQREERG